MGICSSCDATAADVKVTAKLVLPDGKLQEFDRPVSASHVLLLHRDHHPTCFVCNADDMELDGYVTAVGRGEELQPGQLYFLLPSHMLKRPLNGAEMAALAIKANSALTNAASCPCRGSTVGPFPFPLEEPRKAQQRPRRSRDRGRKFMSEMSPILE